MDISVVIPLYNEEESLPELFAWIERVMAANQFSYEVIFVNDGSTDGSWKVIEQLKARSACAGRALLLLHTSPHDKKSVNKLKKGCHGELADII